ncbi:hypothetical protein [Sphingomonas psychrolutea]|uniref:Uncharacterized protein n=1 Tax=Sphingomonas psychrolutea TaxID=1259676 RepID=A0ABQ1H3N1_9SPHN|nr:hypothetical protein [Sphingomonas psychrolutea]GGA56597.1 hypothetical protein GCM10011395_28810 [Sphingomonas psychrolutea]
MNLHDLRRTRLGDALCAFALAVVLAVVWTWRDWAALSALRLPDTDDVMRLQQIRDWIGGQGFADLSQHRLGAAPGLAMHWSRLPDLVPGAMIRALAPLIGSHSAELTAVIVWPTLLFAVALTLTARIARVLGGAPIARTAIVVAAVAFPATTIFLPGRIDHHGLQIVLLLIVVRSLVSRPAMEPGLAAGLAAAASLVIGMETVPLIVAAGVAMTLEWLRARPGADDRMMGFGIGMGAGLLAASIVFRTNSWGYAGCDGFTMIAWRAGVIAAFAPMSMALAARDIAKPVTRAVLGAMIAAVVGVGIVLVAPECLTPYGVVDPLLVRLWLGKVGEAQPLFAAPRATAIGYAGVMMTGIAASAWRLQATRDGRWGALLILQLAALALTCVQLRGAYAGAILAAPGLAGGIAAARARGSVWLASAWVASAGMLYPIAAHAVVADVPRPMTLGQVQGRCTDRDALGDLATLPPARLLAPLDLGAYAVGATRMSVVGAPYHRNNAGNLAVYRFFLGAPAQGGAIARRWRVRYVALCADAFADAPAGSLAQALRRGSVPRWLTPLGPRNRALILFAVEPDLFPEPAAR